MATSCPPIRKLISASDRDKRDCAAPRRTAPATTTITPVTPRRGSTRSPAARIRSRRAAGSNGRLSDIMSAMSGTPIAISAISQRRCASRSSFASSERGQAPVSIDSAAREFPRRSPRRATRSRSTPSSGSDVATAAAAQRADRRSTRERLGGGRFAATTEPSPSPRVLGEGVRATGHRLRDRIVRRAERAGLENHARLGRDHADAGRLVDRELLHRQHRDDRRRRDRRAGESAAPSRATARRRAGPAVEACVSTRRSARPITIAGTGHSHVASDQMHARDVRAALPGSKFETVQVGTTASSHTQTSATAAAARSAGRARAPRAMMLRPRPSAIAAGIASSVATIAAAPL